MPQPTNPEERVSTSTRLMSEEVAIADAEYPLPLVPVVYEFNGGRRLFKEPDPFEY